MTAPSSSRKSRIRSAPVPSSSQGGRSPLGETNSWTGGRSLPELRISVATILQVEVAGDDAVTQDQVFVDRVRRCVDRQVDDELLGVDGQLLDHFERPK